MNHLLAIVGPTAVGKSHLAFQLARTFDAGIVGADSRQVYRYMDIGTAKPPRQELSLVRHHLIDIINPDEEFSLPQYQQLATEAIADIHRQNKLPVLVGGSGLYVWSLLEGWQVPRVPPDPGLRKTLQDKADQIGADGLFQELVKADPVAAQKIDPRNVRRVIRALEVTKYAQAPFSRLQQKLAPSFKVLIIGLTTDRAQLYSRIDSRVDSMIEQGLVEEVNKLMAMGYSLNLPSMSGIGYRQIGMFLGGELTLDSAVRQIKTGTHRFVRHQYSWFRLKDQRIHWFDIQKEVESEITALVAEFIS